jgi:hypothetical protein
MPEWAADELSRNIREAASAGYSESALLQLEENLRRSGLERYIRTALHQIVSGERSSPK